MGGRQTESREGGGRGKKGKGEEKMEERGMGKIEKYVKISGKPGKVEKCEEKHTKILMKFLTDCICRCIIANNMDTGVVNANVHVHVHV